MKRTYVVLCGGVGGSKLADGLARVLPPEALTIVANTGDDFDHLGLRICPDIDTITYMMAGLVNPETGWGREDETWSCIETMRALEGEAWFLLGDRDLALHLHRTDRLKSGDTLSDVTTEIAGKLGIMHRILPMTEEPVRTIVDTDEGTLAFQDYFVRRRCEPRVKSLHFSGLEKAIMTPEVVNALSSPNLKGIFIAPSNPLLSIMPILSVPGMRDMCLSRGVPIIAVSPFIGGQSVKGPAAKLLAELELAAGNAGMCEVYGNFLSGVVAHTEDADVGGVPVEALYTDTMMKNAADRERVAQECLTFLDRIAV